MIPCRIVIILRHLREQDLRRLWETRIRFPKSGVAKQAELLGVLGEIAISRELSPVCW